MQGGLMFIWLCGPWMALLGGVLFDSEPGSVGVTPPEEAAAVEVVAESTDGLPEAAAESAAPPVDIPGAHPPAP